MARYTKKFIEARFELAMRELGLATGPLYVDRKAQVGNHFIDHQPAYGGYQIRMMCSEGGGQSCPFGMERHSASEFVALLSGLIYAADTLNDQRRPYVAAVSALMDTARATAETCSLAQQHLKAPKGNIAGQLEEAHRRLEAAADLVTAKAKGE